MLGLDQRGKYNTFFFKGFNKLCYLYNSQETGYGFGLEGFCYNGTHHMTLRGPPFLFGNIWGFGCRDGAAGIVSWDVFRWRDDDSDHNYGLTS
jgi:hypothetical protein